MAVVTTPEQFMHALAVRAICFLEQGNTTYQQAIDGNDYQATHIVAYAGSEPIGATRIRWFRDFAKIERTAFRPDYRSVRILKLCSDFIFSHVARKGYDRLITHAEPNYARVWEMVLGFERIESRPEVRFENHEPMVELVKRLAPVVDVVTASSDPTVLFRIEGHWEKPHACENNIV
jgi:hypothetical protein